MKNNHQNYNHKIKKKRNSKVEETASHCWAHLIRLAISERWKGKINVRLKNVFSVEDGLENDKQGQFINPELNKSS